MSDRRFHAIDCDDSTCSGSCPHVPPIRYVPASGMFERLVDGRWYVLDMVEQPER
jgi:hypothetical protein